MHRGRAASTWERRLAAIAVYHRSNAFESPTEHEVVCSVHRGLRRRVGVAQSQKTALIDDGLGTVVGAIDDENLAGARGRALLLVGFAGALRRSELAALEFSDLRFEFDGMVVRLRHSKGDQEGARVALRDAGFRVFAFDGPGQGGALEEYGLAMTEQWERPVAAMLDHFGLADATLLAFLSVVILAIRAAAFEQRIRRVISDDIMTDFLRATLRRQGHAANVLVPGLVAVRAAGLLNALRRARMRSSFVAEWGTRQRMHVQGLRTPAEFFDVVRRYSTLAFRTWSDRTCC